VTLSDYELRIDKHREFILSPERDFLLGVRINDRRPNRYPYEECFDSPRKALELALEFLKPSLALDSDFVPSLYPIQFRMVHPIPALFGCPMTLISDDARVMPIIKNIEQVWDMDVPSLDNKVLHKVFEHLEYYRKNAPPGLPIAPPSEQSPFVIAYQLRGDDIFLDLYDHPAEVKRLLELITDTFVQVEREYKLMLNERNEYRASFQYMFVPGLRIAADSNVMLAPEFIEEFEMPCLERIAGEFGPLAVHYCGNYSTPGHQFADALSRHNFVKIVQTQLEAYLDDRNIHRRDHSFKLSSIWEIQDLPGFLEKFRDSIRETMGILFLVQVGTRKEAEELIRQWPWLRDSLRDPTTKAL
jgi:hypothetical protein